jgi:hypothetical protein
VGEVIKKNTPIETKDLHLKIHHTRVVTVVGCFDTVCATRRHRFRRD